MAMAHDVPLEDAQESHVLVVMIIIVAAAIVIVVGGGSMTGWCEPPRKVSCKRTFGVPD